MSIFTRFLAASGLTNLGDGIAIVTWGWVATLLTRDPLLIALVPVALKAPWFAVSLPAGVIVDRVDRRRLILLADIMRAVAFTLVGLVIWMALPLDTPPLRGTDQPWLFGLISGAAIAVGVAEVLRDTAAQTMVPSLVADADLEKANGRIWTVEMVANMFAGTALAGVLLAIFTPLPFLVIGACMALAALITASIRGTFRADHEGTAPQHWMRDLREGIAYLVASPSLRKLAIFTGIYNFAFEASMVTLVLIVQERLGLGPLALSAIFASGAAGGVLVGLFNHHIVGWLGKSWSLKIGALGAVSFPLAVVVSGVGDLWLICLGFFIGEALGVLWNTVSVSYRQRLVPARLLGRVNSAYRLFTFGMAPLGMITAGLLTRGTAPIWGRETALLSPFVMAAFAFLAATLWYWRFLSQSFDVERTPPPR